MPRTYLVVVDNTPEARLAARFAARRASKTGSAVELVTVITPPEFSAFGGVQAAMAEEERLRADALLAAVADEAEEVSGLRPTRSTVEGEAAPALRALLAGRADVAALVLGAAAEGAPGPLVAHFAGQDAGRLPCPVTIVPGGLGAEAIERLS